MIDLRSEVESVLLGRQGSRRRGDEIEFLCVAHDEHSASAAWNGHKGAWNCRVPACGAVGTTYDLAMRLGIPVPEKKQPDDFEARLVTAYDYRNEDGVLLFQTVRLHSPKDFSQRQPNGSGWTYNLKGVRRVLYRLPELVALPAGSHVCVVEGEKDVENLRMEGFNTTCNPMGAEKFSTCDPKALTGMHVAILVDRDESGDKHGQQVARILQPLAASVRVVPLPGLTWKKKAGPDVSDWFAQGGTAEELRAIIAAAPAWEPVVAASGLAAFPPSNAGHAEAFASLYGDTVRYDHTQKRWLVWMRHRWMPDPDGVLYRMALDTSRKWAKSAADLPEESAKRLFGFAKGSGESSAGIAGMFKAAEGTPPLADEGAGWDAQPLLLGCENGVFNLATGQFRPGAKEDRVTLSTGVYADPAATCERWLRFLEEVFENDSDVIAFIQRAVGYTLTGDTREQVWFLGHGGGANGKSTFVDTVYLLLGGYAGDTPAETICGRGAFASGQASPDIANIKGKRIVICSETEEMGKVNAGRMKWLTGQTPVTARVLYSNPVTFVPNAKIWLTTNKLPRVDDDSEGFWRRVRLIPFNRRFEGAERENGLEERLKDELPGILNWAVAGAKAWLTEGLRPPQKVMLATNAYRQKSDPLAEFIADCCSVGEGRKATRGQLYKAYYEWCDRQGMDGQERLGSRAFGNRVEEHNPNRPSHGTRWYVGIGIRVQGEEESGDVTGPLGDATTLSSENAGTFSSSSRDRGKMSERTSPTSPTSPDAKCDCDWASDRHDDCPQVLVGKGFAAKYHCEIHCPDVGQKEE